MKLIDVRCCPELKLWWLSSDGYDRFYHLIGLFWVRQGKIKAIKLVLFCLSVTIFVSGTSDE